MLPFTVTVCEQRDGHDEREDIRSTSIKSIGR